MRTLGWLAAALLWARSALSHDFWLAASPWQVAPGAQVVVTANVGDDTYPRSQSVTAAERVDSLRLFGPATTLLAPAYRIQDKALAADVKMPAAPATYVVAMVVKGRFLSMEGDKFIDYLKEEGLDSLVDEVNRRGEAASKSRERYWRDAKMLIRVGGASGDLAGGGATQRVTQPLGLSAELVPDSDLTTARIGDLIGVRLLHDGKPVPGAQISLAASSLGPLKDRVSRARTDSAGRAMLPLAHRGPYLLTAVHMVRRSGESGPEAADWESYWCSLTFDLGPGRAKR